MQQPSTSTTRPKNESGRGFGFLWLATAFGWAIWVLAMGTEADPPGSWLSNLLGDKVVHAGSFALGGILWIHSLRRVARLRVITAVVCGGVVSFLFGLLMEAFQRNIPGRDADPGDLVANLAGILLATGLYVVASGLSSRK